MQRIPMTPAGHTAVVAELKELCKEKKIKGYSKWNKAKLLAECGDPN